MSENIYGIRKRERPWKRQIQDVEKDIVDSSDRKDTETVGAYSEVSRVSAKALCKYVSIINTRKII